MTNLVAQLRALAKFEHGDLTIADDAADEIERLEANAAHWNQLLKDCMETPCKYPCLRDDLGDWMSAHGIKWLDEQPDESETPP
jgi:hypothetical protein